MKIEEVKKDEEHTLPVSYFGDNRGGCTRGILKENGLYFSFDSSDGSVSLCGFFLGESKLEKMGYFHISKIANFEDED